MCNLKFNYRYLEGAELVGQEKYPQLSPTILIPDKVISFNERNQIKNPREFYLDHFIADRLFECSWNDCDKYLSIYKKFKGIIGADFSVYRDGPSWERKYNVGRNRTLAYYLQKNGINVAPVASWAYMDDFVWCLEGLPFCGSIAVSTNGCINNFISRCVFIEGVRIIQETLRPRYLVICGGPVAELDEKYDNIIYYKNFSQRMAERIKNGK